MPMQPYRNIKGQFLEDHPIGFKSGHTPWNKNKSVRLNPKGEFKKGHIPYYLEDGEYDPRKHPAWKGFRITNNKIRGNGNVFKKILIIDIGKCEICGNKDKRVLILHHKNFDNKNNLRENLQLICANCHMIIHYGGDKNSS